MAENKDLIRIVALIKKAGLSAHEIVKAMRGTRRRKKVSTNKLEVGKVAHKYRNPPDKTQILADRRRMPAWGAGFSKAGKPEKSLIKN
jgi:hypothetical protein